MEKDHCAVYMHIYTLSNLLTSLSDLLIVNTPIRWARGEQAACGRVYAFVYLEV